MAMTPGTYLRKRREAAGLSIDDVAFMLPTEPRMDDAGRIAWLRQIESDEAPIGDTVVKALRFAFAFKATVLRRLDDLRRGADLPELRLCRRCACSELDTCNPPCSWVAEDLCSACPVDDPGEDAQPANDEGDNAPEPDHTQGIAA